MKRPNRKPEFAAVEAVASTGDSSHRPSWARWVSSWPNSSASVYLTKVMLAAADPGVPVLSHAAHGGALEARKLGLAGLEQHPRRQSPSDAASVIPLIVLMCCSG